MVVRASLYHLQHMSLVRRAESTIFQRLQANIALAYFNLRGICDGCCLQQAAECLRARLRSLPLRKDGERSPALPLRSAPVRAVRLTERRAEESRRALPMLTGAVRQRLHRCVAVMELQALDPRTTAVRRATYGKPTSRHRSRRKMVTPFACRCRRAVHLW